MRAALIDAACVMGQGGFGWMVTSQTRSSVHPEIIQKTPTHFLGFRGEPRQGFHSSRQLVGGTGPALDLCQLFRDPHSAFGVTGRQYSFMTIGPVSRLFVAGTPLFLTASDRVDEVLAAHRLPRVEQQA